MARIKFSILGLNSKILRTDSFYVYRPEDLLSISWLVDTKVRGVSGIKKCCSTTCFIKQSNCTFQR